MKHSSRGLLVLGALLLGGVGALWLWQTPGLLRAKLSADEIDRYVDLMQKQLPVPPQERAELLARVRAWAEADDGQPVYMLNLMRLHEQLRSFPGAPEFAGTPQAANQLYESEVVPILLGNGGYPLFSGTVQGPNLVGYDPSVDRWSRVLVVRSRSRRAFLDMMTDPAYGPIEPYKLMAFDTYVAPMSAEVIVPDVRFVAAVTALAIFLAAGWWRAAHRRPPPA